jgi:hypothetical protein
MRILIIVLLLMIGACCSDRKTTSGDVQESMDIYAIDAAFPLQLSNIDFNRSTSAKLDGVIHSKIRNTIEDYYTNNCVIDSFHTYQDTYLNTIRVKDSLHTIFLILLKNYPTEELTAKVLFYDNRKKAFIDETLDFKIYGLYEWDHNQLKPTNLKTDFKLDTPEIQVIDFDRDGVSDLKFTRLFHNGTFNSIHSAVLTLKNSNLDTLDFNEERLGKWTEK